MNDVVMIKKHNLGTKTSVYGVHVYGCNHCIAPYGEQMLRKRGFHMTDDEIKDMLHNLPKEFKPYVRFISDESKAKHYEENKIEKVKEIIEVKEEIKKEIEKVEEKIKDIGVGTAQTILDTDYSEFDDDKLYKFKIELKAYAKEQGIKIHPALKDIAKIIEKIKG
jgi:hypothetical protein